MAPPGPPEVDATTAAAYLQEPEGWWAPDPGGPPVLVVDLDSPRPPGQTVVPVMFPGLVVGMSRAIATPECPAESVDVALTAASAPQRPWVSVADVDAEATRMCERAAAWPVAAVTLAQVLRAGVGMDVPAGLVLESVAYSTLQAGPEFGRWLEHGHPTRHPVVDNYEPVLIDRDGDRLRITLNRPEVHNAYNALMRDRLYDALRLGAADPGVVRIELRGAGRSFCSGGDLSEFGTLVDPAHAHLVRTRYSPARLLASLSERVTAYLHGACMGSGIELPAFAHSVVASSDTVVRLPELEMGLIPGAGGTVSLARRVGRARTGWLVWSGLAIDARTARAWGLVDELAEQAR